MVDQYPMADVVENLTASPTGHVTRHNEERAAINKLNDFISGFGVAPLDLFAIGGTDDQKMAAAIAYCAGLATNRTPRIGLSNRLYNFNVSLGQPYNGFHLEGVGRGQLSAISTTKPGYHTTLKLEIPRAGAGLPGYWIDASSSTAWDYWIGGFNAYSDNGFTQAYRAPLSAGGFRECNFHDQTWQNMYAVFGNVSEGCAMTICNVTGGWSIFECRSQGVTIQGSDNRKIFGDGVDWFHSSAVSGSTGLSQWMGEFRSLGKSNVGPIYITAFNGWRGLKITGGATAGLLSIDGAVIEGNNAGQPCHGSLVRIEGGNVSMSNTTIDDGMSNPTNTTSPYSNTATANGSGIADRGLVEILAGAQVSMVDIGWAHATGVDATTMPCVYNASSKFMAARFQTFTRGPGWGAQLPIVKGTAPWTSDATMQYTP